MSEQSEPAAAVTEKHHPCPVVPDDWYGEPALPVCTLPYPHHGQAHTFEPARPLRRLFFEAALATISRQDGRVTGALLADAIADEFSAKAELPVTPSEHPNAQPGIGARERIAIAVFHVDAPSHVMGWDDCDQERYLCIADAALRALDSIMHVEAVEGQAHAD